MIPGTPWLRYIYIYIYLLLVHALGREGETHGHRGEQAFGHVGDDDTDHEHQVGDQLRLHHETQDEEDDSQGDSDSRDDLQKTKPTKRLASVGDIHKYVNK